MKEPVKLFSEIEKIFLKQQPSQEIGRDRETAVLRKMTKDVE